MSLSPATLRELRSVLERTEADIAALEQYAEHLRGVLKFAPTTEAQNEGRQERASATFKMTPVRDEAERILREAGEPLHYREIHQRLIKRGVEVRGKDPARTVGAQLSADDERFYSIGANTGKWALVEWKAIPPQQPAPAPQIERPVQQETEQTDDPWADGLDYLDAIDESNPAHPFFTEDATEPRQLPPFEDHQQRRVAY